MLDYKFFIHADLHVTQMPESRKFAPLAKDIGPIRSEEELLRFAQAAPISKDELQTVYKRLTGNTVKFNNRPTACKRIWSEMEAMQMVCTRPGGHEPEATETAPTATEAKKAPVQPVTVPTPTQDGYAEPAPVETTMARGMKIKGVYDMLCSESGATIAEIQAVTGWLPHTTRSTVTAGIPKRFDCKVARTKEDGRGSVYRVVKAA